MGEAANAEVSQGLKAVEAFNKSFDEQRSRATRGPEVQPDLLLHQRKRRRTGSVEDTRAKRPNANRNTDDQDGFALTTHEDANERAEHTAEERNIHGPQGIDDSNEDGPVYHQSSWSNSYPGCGFSNTNGYGNLESIESYMTPLTDANMHLRIQSLPILANLSTQILTNLAMGSYDDALTMVTQPESDPGQAYATLKSLFDQTKKLYSDQDAFLDAYQLSLHDPTHRATIRKANLATFVSSVFGSQDVGFYHLNEHFLETFVPEGGKLLKSQGGLFLDLKTQAYISAMAHIASSERTKAEILDDLFPEDMDQRLLARRPGAKQLQPGELDFLTRARSRRDMLMNEDDEGENGKDLTEKYIWNEFLRDVSAYVSKNLDAIVSPVDATSSKGKNRRGREPSDSHQVAGTHHFQVQVTENHEARSDGNQNDISQREAVDKAARAAQMVLSAELYGNGRDGSVQRELSEEHPQEHAEHLGNEDEDFGQIPHSDQSAPTQVLYERARLAATAKATPSNRRAGLPSQRRPWTTEEENALMAGLDRVKGPHWSQILAMFGPGGSINESLKDRNQVQLKDKARNLKLFFLKSGIEVPHYLQFVTGDLKTRAPGQAAKNEAKARAKLKGEEDRAHIEGVLALASGGRRKSHSPSFEDEDDSGGGEATGGTQELSYEEQLAEQMRADQAGQENISFERSTA
ncbi:hypothetical protein GP486_001813 [Trichoglossum hirsutum]|uniref:HTH myb-type domain-containing protein n=1 Tax=Trichoglossum hirsutum TaxID=265104 RepID=A0A9P8LG72_9PEZI|nr:hypothetical protein GP486_001813 [Trichoglossum hirsutum]